MSYPSIHIASTAEDERQISGRLRDALVADLVLERPDTDYWLTVRLRDPHEWTRHLARQLRLDIDSRGGIHDTLMVLVPELDRLMGSWPPLHDPRWCRRHGA